MGLRARGGASSRRGLKHAPELGREVVGDGSQEPAARVAGGPSQLRPAD
jgi:hypothetical protein